jgi:hypothetical protein
MTRAFGKLNEFPFAEIRDLRAGGGVQLPDDCTKQSCAGNCSCGRSVPKSRSDEGGKALIVSLVCERARRLERMPDALAATGQGRILTFSPAVRETPEETPTVSPHLAFGSRLSNPPRPCGVQRGRLLGALLTFQPLCWQFVAPRVGLEPTTLRLTGRAQDAPLATGAAFRRGFLRINALKCVEIGTKFGTKSCRAGSRSTKCRKTDAEVFEPTTLG